MQQNYPTLGPDAYGDAEAVHPAWVQEGRLALRQAGKGISAMQATLAHNGHSVGPTESPGVVLVRFCIPIPVRRVV